jgi:hypothetical protein
MCVYSVYQNVLKVNLTVTWVLRSQTIVGIRGV